MGKLLAMAFDELVEEHLEQPTFVLDYPIEISPLAKPHRSKPGAFNLPTHLRPPHPPTASPPTYGLPTRLQPAPAAYSLPAHTPRPGPNPTLQSGPIRPIPPRLRIACLSKV